MGFGLRRESTADFSQHANPQGLGIFTLRTEAMRSSPLFGGENPTYTSIAEWLPNGPLAEILAGA